MAMPAWINAVGEEGTINEIVGHIVDLHRDLHNMGIDSRPPPHPFLERSHYVAELCRLYNLKCEQEMKWDVV